MITTEMDDTISSEKLSSLLVASVTVSIFYSLVKYENSERELLYTLHSSILHELQTATHIYPGTHTFIDVQLRAIIDLNSKHTR
jgi:hypothetical protein